MRPVQEVGLSLGVCGAEQWRQDVKTGVGARNFFDMSQMSGVQGAHLVNDKKVHVLIDLVGYTGGGERANEVFAAQVAPAPAFAACPLLILA